MITRINITEPYYATVVVEKTHGNPPLISDIESVHVFFDGLKLDVTAEVSRDIKLFNKLADRIMREYEKVRSSVT